MNIILWVILMIKRWTNINKIILPNKKINLFVISILFLGVILGGVYANIIGVNDRNLVINKIKLFIDNINSNSLVTMSVFKNSLGINLCYVLIIWILGMSLLGLLFNILLLFMKGFIFGFSMASFIITYGAKGLVLSFIYLLFGQLLNIIILLILVIYTVIFSIKLIMTILKKNYNGEIMTFIRKYIIIFLLCILGSLISSLCESFLLPSLIKLVIKLYV